MPYTINFNDDGSTPRRRASSTAPRRPPIGLGAPGRKVSMMNALAPIGDEESDSLSFFAKLDPSSPAIHFNEADDPLTLARSDAHVPEWGRGQSFYQPRSKVSQTPPLNIFEYSKAQEEYAAENLRRLRSTQQSLSPVQEGTFSNVDWSVKPGLQGNGGLKNAILAVSKAGHLDNMLFVGTLGFPTDVLDDSKKADIEDRLENEHDAVAVYVADTDLDGHYIRFCKTILWPSLHYQIPDHPKSKAYEDHSWVFYEKVNIAFTNRILKSYKHGDTVWVNDYHLLLVPGLLRKKLPEGKIGFFLHTSFPSSEVFRCLAVRKQLLEGMLGANLVVFQTSEYAQHFLQTCSRLLAVEVSEHGVQLEDRFVAVTHVPIGIVTTQLAPAKASSEVSRWTKSLTEKYWDKKIIVARDKLDKIRGIKQKLLAYERFLDKHPEWRDKVIMIQVATSSAGDDKDFDSSISEIATRLNSKFSTLAHQPLVFFRQDIAFSHYLALLSAADMLMVTSTREGLNLTCHEYILCQDGHGAAKMHGPLILSEFAGSASIIGGGELSVNPWDMQQVSEAIKTALEMNQSEKDARHERMLSAVQHYNGIHWFQELQSRLELAYQKPQLKDTMSVPRLSAPALREAYRSSKKRLFILDFDGTLVENSASQPRSFLTLMPRVIDALRNIMISSDRNVIYVSSGRKCEDLEHLFHQIPGLGLIAENGCFVRPFDEDHWVDLAQKASLSTAWKEGVLNLLSYYQERIEGSSIEDNKQYSLAFRFEKTTGSDKESAERQAGDAANHINESCQSQRFHAVPLPGAILVEPTNVDKSTAAKWITQAPKQGDDMLHPSSASLPAYELSKRLSGIHLSRDGQDDTTPRAFTGSSTSQTYVGRSSDLSENSDPPSPPPPTGPGSVDPTTAAARAANMASDLAHVGFGAGEVPSEKVSFDTERSAPTPRSRTTSVREVNLPEFLMVAGNDREDEPLFRWANAMMKGATHHGSTSDAVTSGGGSERSRSESIASGPGSATGGLAPPESNVQVGSVFESGVSGVSERGIKNVFSICVGKKSTEAKYTQGVTGLIMALRKLMEGGN